MILLTSIIPSVIVPVLSKQIVSTLASVSIQYSCWTNTFCLPSLITLTAITELVSKSNPSGIIPIKAPTVLNTDVVKFPVILNWLYIRIIPTGTITILSTLSIFSNEDIIIELTFLLYLASILILEI